MTLVVESSCAEKCVIFLVAFRRGDAVVDDTLAYLLDLVRSGDMLELQSEGLMAQAVELPVDYSPLAEAWSRRPRDLIAEEAFRVHADFAGRMFPSLRDTADIDRDLGVPAVTVKGFFSIDSGPDMDAIISITRINQRFESHISPRHAAAEPDIGSFLIRVSLRFEIHAGPSGG